ncbi:MAG: IS200/IS605 family transposase [Verrucomicrobiota bacterium]
MSQSLAKILVHLVFSTKYREPLLRDDCRAELHKYMAAIFKEFGSPAIRINSVEDHVHVLFCQSKNHSLARVVEEIKKGSSKWIKTKGLHYRGFHWQNGYGAFSVSQSNWHSVERYIANQAEHHRKITFQEEYRAFLGRYQIPFDERYVWD